MTAPKFTPGSHVPEGLDTISILEVYDGCILTDDGRERIERLESERADLYAARERLLVATSGIGALGENGLREYAEALEQARAALGKAVGK